MFKRVWQTCNDSVLVSRQKGKFFLILIDRHGLSRYTMCYWHGTMPGQNWGQKLPVFQRRSKLQKVMVFSSFWLNFDSIELKMMTFSKRSLLERKYLSWRGGSTSTTRYFLPLAAKGELPNKNFDSECSVSLSSSKGANFGRRFHRMFDSLRLWFKPKQGTHTMWYYVAQGRPSRQIQWQAHWLIWYVPEDNDAFFGLGDMT